MIEERFLVDSNSFITPYRSYYAFDLIPAYWNELLKHIKKGRLILLDMVRSEIDKGQDDLAKWLDSQQDFIICNHKNQKIIEQYSLVIRYIESSELYSLEALRRWSEDVADPWLIAAAKVNGYTIISSESPSGALSAKQPSKNPKIPDVARKFGVKTENVYYMMRRLGIKI